jgi:hypothetical protein
VRAWIALAVCVLALAGCGGDDEEDGNRQPAAPAPAAPGTTESEAATTESEAEQTETAPTFEGEGGEGGAGDEEPVRSQAVFIGEDGRVTPTRIEVPSYIAVQVILQARDDQPYVLEMKGRSLRPGDTLDLDGLRPDERVVGNVGGQRVVVSATAEPGP